MQQGDKLPVLDQLAENFNVSKSTIIKALDILEIRGRVYQVRGSGIFVRRHRRKGYVNLLEAQGFKNDMSEFELTSKVLGLQLMVPNETVQSMLNLEDGEQVYQVKRIRYVENQPFCLEESYYRKSVVKYLNEQIISESIFQYLQESLELKIGFVDMYFRLTALSKEQAEIMEEKEHAPAMLLESVYHLHNGEPFNFSILWYHKDQCQFFIQSNNF